MAAAGTIASLPLVQSSDLTYLGAFRLPFDAKYDGSYNNAAGFAMAFDPNGNGGAGSLFYADRYIEFGEVSIPSLIDQTGANNYDMLNVATALQSLTTCEGGNLVGTDLRPRGGLIVGSDLVAGFGVAYDVGGQTITHYRRPKTLGAGSVTVRKITPSSPYANARYSSGYMCEIPKGLQSALGGTAVTGWVANSINSNASNGPTAFAFDPDALISGNITNAQPLAVYPLANALQTTVYDYSTTNQAWDDTSLPAGVCIPNGTRSMLFMGRHGYGPMWYGDGTGADFVGSDNWHYDPTDGSKGEHAYPYRYQTWMLDCAQLAEVKAGTRNPYDLTVTTWGFNLPFEGTSSLYSTGSPDPSPDPHIINGMCYDKTNKRIFLSTQYGVYNFTIIHAFRVNNAVAA